MPVPLKMLPKTLGYVPIAPTFGDWTQGRRIPVLSTNSGASELPFQRWRRFKESFAPELLERAVNEHPVAVQTCLDPFGGSGTTPLASQFLGIHSVTSEVNPYLADLIEAKLTTYDADALARDFGRVLAGATAERLSPQWSSHLPRTFVEPGVNHRWLFDRGVAKELFRLGFSIERTSNIEHRRLFRVLLGGILMECSNAVTSGKGRRYRSNWQQRRVPVDSVIRRFAEAAKDAIREIYRYRDRLTTSYELIRGDSRNALKRLHDIDLAVFSPPYPNSFDYTDVYNVELWMLGYLTAPDDNMRLRMSTLSSHVQLLRDYAEPPASPLLQTVLSSLVKNRSDLWNPWLPNMVGAYFSDIKGILDDVHAAVRPNGRSWIVVGDSAYADILVPTAQIILETIVTKWKAINAEPFRSMRTSPQQGGHCVLDETLIVLERLP